MRVGILGSRGYLGRILLDAIPSAVPIHQDVTDYAGLLKAIDGSRYSSDDGEFSTIINAAAKTGRPNVDWCETNRDATYAVNTLGALLVAKACALSGPPGRPVHLIHLSSGCIFYGRSPHADGQWRESDPANPVSWYSKTKYAADLILAELPNVTVLRLRMPLHTVPHPRNLITKLASYDEVIDVENSVTVLDDLVTVIVRAIERRPWGVVHATNPGSLTHRTLMQRYTEIVDPSHVCTIVPEAELVEQGVLAKPRSNCVLADTRLSTFGAAMRPIDAALPLVLEQYKRHLAATRPS